jgi:hypothetical protein
VIPTKEYLHSVRPKQSALYVALDHEDPCFNLEVEAQKRVNTILPAGETITRPEEMPEGTINLSRDFDIVSHVLYLILYLLTPFLEEISNDAVLHRDTQTMASVGSRSGVEVNLPKHKKAQQPLDKTAALAALEKLVRIRIQFRPDTREWLRGYLDFFKYMSGRLTTNGLWYIDIVIRSYCDARMLPYIPIPAPLRAAIEHATHYAGHLTQDVCRRCLFVGTHTHKCPFFTSDPKQHASVDTGVRLKTLESEVTQLKKQLTHLRKSNNTRNKHQHKRSSWQRVCLDFQEDPNKCPFKDRCKFRHELGCNICRSSNHSEKDCKKDQD